MSIYREVPRRNGGQIIDDCIAGTCLVGAYQEDGSSLPEILYEFPAAGTYYLVVDGEGGSCGPFEVTGEIRPTAVGVVEPPTKMSALSLSTIPNPSRNVVLIRGRLPLPGVDVATIAIYDIAGKLVVERNVAFAGVDIVFEWDGRDAQGGSVSAGTYFVRVIAGSEVLEQKVTLVR